MNSHTFKSGTNRGNRRVWLEGDRLLKINVRRGLKFSREFVSDDLVLMFSGEGRHTVAGTNDRPIIDLNGAYLNEWLGNSTGFVATFCAATDNQPPKISLTPTA